MTSYHSTKSERSLYRYTPIGRETKSIRVMRLHPAEDFDAELCCNILEVQFKSEDFPDYEAISYTWDGAIPSEGLCIVCEDDNTNPQKLLITRSSAIALRHLRKKDSNRMLWMDSVCIDQSSIQDRNHQVQLIGGIYTRAQRVLIWLGEDESLRVGPTFSLLKDLAQLEVDSTADKDDDMEDNMDDDIGEDEDDDIDDNMNDDDDEEEEEEEEEEEDMGDDGEQDEKGDDNDDGNTQDDRNNGLNKTKAAEKSKRKELKSKMQGIWDVPQASDDDDIYAWHLYSEVYGRPWFNRMWTLQEIALSDPDTALVICSQHEILWKQLQTASQKFREIGLDGRDLINSTMQLYSKLHLYIRCSRLGLDDLLRRLVHPKKRNKPIPQVSDIFADCRLRDCTDPKDKAFALYGLCSELKIQLPYPTYEKNTAQIFTEVARAIITHDDDLDVLYLVNSPRRIEDLPSWVPDWSDSWKSEGLNLRYRYSTQFQASSSKALYSFSQDSKSLILLAKIVDTVSGVGKPIPIVEEKLGPQLPGIFKRTSPDWFSRSYAVWEAVQSWARLVSDSERDVGPYGSESNDWMIAFLDTMMAHERVIDSIKQRKRERSLEERVEEMRGFLSWYKSLNGQNDFKRDFEQGLLEDGFISAPGELGEETIAHYHMSCSLWLAEDHQLMEFHDSVWAFHRGMSFFMTNEGWMGTVEGLPAEGDVVALISGLSMPIVLRRDAGNYRLVGHAYVHGLMDGKWPNSLDALELITIV
ncbi:hypothetical protein FGG08_005973 [Glutinoglossum americanum]|uniref:Heterokaryon incompatibility domain-containing protein n=1 Tax=Glutinoglossum americanum TaxID=1670608 RepID=A0A9P8I4G6_9PEZI|nr:hypothetical protein FGG08_005973 [Glutinoglossum americanum]